MRSTAIPAFVLALGLSAAAAAAATLPTYITNGRMFYAAQISGNRYLFWLDTDGGGFVTEETARALHLAVSEGKTRLPNELVQPTTAGGLLPVIRPDPNDAIFAGVAGQLGATWFQGRIVCFNYRLGQFGVLDAVPVSAGSSGRATLSFPMRGGSRIDGEQYPSVDVAVDGERTYSMSLDTAATVLLSSQTVRALNDAWGATRATSFLRRSILNDWHRRHPGWRYLANAGASSGVDMIEVPALRVGTRRATNVWFSTRPGDDVFEMESAAGKLGPTAYSNAVVTLDYPAGALFFD